MLAGNTARTAAIAAVSCGAGFALTYAATKRFVPEPTVGPLPTERERQDIFNKLAPKWDATVRFDEFMAGIGRNRRKLIQRAEGNVLEVAVGSGRNFPYYSSAKVTSLTALDFSRPMLEVCDAKRKELEPISLRLKLATTSKLDFEDGTFDTVVDTFGICSFEAPLEALREMRRVTKQDGKILLLEHGASSWEVIQGLLNRTAHRHVEKFGCYPNRDIVSLVEKAGMHVEVDQRKHFGTTYTLICRPNPPTPDPEAFE